MTDCPSDACPQSVAFQRFHPSFNSEVYRGGWSPHVLIRDVCCSVRSLARNQREGEVCKPFLMIAKLASTAGQLDNLCLCLQRLSVTYHVSCVVSLSSNDLTPALRNTQQGTAAQKRDGVAVLENR